MAVLKAVKKESSKVVKRVEMRDTNLVGLKDEQRVDWMVV